MMTHRTGNNDTYDDDGDNLNTMKIMTLRMMKNTKMITNNV